MTNKYGFILINPQLGENIGASARALKNFGFKNLLITKPRDGWPNVKAQATSVGAVDVLNKTEILETTEDVIKKFDIIYSTMQKNLPLIPKEKILFYSLYINEGVDQSLFIFTGANGSVLKTSDTYVPVEVT